MRAYNLFAIGTYTNKQVAEITGLGKNTVKEIDKKRLQSIYTTDNGKKLIKPEKSGYEAKYDALLQENILLFTLDLVKEKLSAAYAMTDEAKMADAIIDIMDICKATGNKHLLWFGKL